MELAGLSLAQPWSDTELTQQGRHRGLQTNTEPGGSVKKREINPSWKGLHWISRTRDCLAAQAQCDTTELCPAPLGSTRAGTPGTAGKQLFFLFFFPQGCARALQSPLAPNQPRVVASERGRRSPACLETLFLHHRKEGSKERQLSLPGSHCSNSGSCRSREKSQFSLKTHFLLC